MSIINDLKKQRRLWIQPSCGHSFFRTEASFFDATKPLKGEALDRHNARIDDDGGYGASRGNGG